MATSKTKEKINKATLAKSEDGSIQITFSIPFEEVKAAKKKAAEVLAKEVEVAGFRKGMAPVEKAMEALPEKRLIEEAMAQILPTLFAEAINEHKLKPAIYPRFELISAEEGKVWQIRAVTAEIPEITLGDYKSKVKGALSSKALWTPEKGGDKERKLTKEEKQQIIAETLIKSIKVKLPKVLVEEEVNSRLGSLLEKIEKLGLTLEGYLSSIGKTAESLREEYEKSAENALLLDLILNEIAKKENLKVTEKEAEEAIEATHTVKPEKDHKHSESEKRIVMGVLIRRKALDSLTSLVG